MVFKQKLDVENLKAETFKVANIICSKKSCKNNKRKSPNYGEQTLKEIHLLLNCYSVSTNDKYLQAIYLLADELYGYHQTCPFNLSFEHGATGIAYTFIKIFEVTHNKTYLTRACDIITVNSNHYLDSQETGDSLFSGRCGIILVLLFLLDKTSESKFLKYLESYSKSVIMNAVVIDNGLAWYNPYELITRPLGSYGYGSAGIGYTFDLLGEYFDCALFKEVATKAYAYVEESCLDSSTGTWRDYRKNIYGRKDFEEHMENYLNNNVSFFGESIFNHSIAHGTSGIGFAQLHKGLNIENMNDISSIEFLNDAEAIDMAHLYLELNSKHNRSLYLDKVVFLLKNSTHKNELDLALLKISILKKESCHYMFPKIQLGSCKSKKKEKVFSNFGKLTILLAHIPFERTISYLKEFDSVEAIGEKTSSEFSLPVEFIPKWIDNLYLTSNQLKVLSETYDYERRLQGEVLKLKQNPVHHIAQFIAEVKRIESLNIEDTELIKRELVVSNTISVHKRYVEVDMISQIIDLPEQIDVLWKYSTQDGIEEMPYGLMGFIVFRFKKSKSIETAMMEVLLYCCLAKEKELKPLIEYSSSKNKKDLINRLPFLFIYQIRLLVADGVLEFTDSTSKGFDIKRTFLKTVLGVMKVSIHKTT